MNLKLPTLLLSMPVQIPIGGLLITLIMSPTLAQHKESLEWCYYDKLIHWLTGQILVFIFYLKKLDLNIPRLIHPMALASVNLSPMQSTIEHHIMYLEFEGICIIRAGHKVCMDPGSATELSWVGSILLQSETVSLGDIGLTGDSTWTSKHETMRCDYSVQAAVMWRCLVSHH